MVGVAGKSKACNTCRKRRVTCDLAKPQCMRCIKGNRVCGGYERETVYVSYQPKKIDKVTTISVREISKRRSKSSDNVDGSLSRETSHSSSSSRSTTASTELSIIDTFDNFGTTPELRDSIFNYFVSTLMPTSGHVDQKLQPWYIDLASLPFPSGAIASAVMALSLARLGRDTDDPALIHHSLLLYGKGLRELQLALWDEKLMFQDETLGACMALSMYEIVECPSKTRYGYVSHQNGCARLVRMRGPESFRGEGLGHKIFCVFRLQEIMQSLASRTPSFVAEDCWQSVLSFDQPQQELMGILASIPTLIQQSDQLRDLLPAPRLSPVLTMAHDVCQAAHDFLEGETTISMGAMMIVVPFQVLTSCFRTDPELRGDCLWALKRLEVWTGWISGPESGQMMDGSGRVP